MSSLIKAITTDDKQQKKNIRRRFVPISFEINTQGQHVTFEKKLPFKTAKVVGMMTIVSQQFDQFDGQT